MLARPVKWKRPWRNAAAGALAAASVTGCQFIIPGQPIRSGDVNRWNLDRFETQTRQALPVGASRAQVEAYLRQMRLSFDYTGESYAPYFDHQYQVWIDSIGTGFCPLPSPIRLNIEIDMGADERLDQIKFSQMMTDCL